jgi:hypothetical protein
MNTRLKIGDGLWRIVTGTMLSHHGVVVGFNGEVPVILENQKGLGSRLVSYDEFAKNRKVRIEPRPHGEEWEFVTRAQNVLSSKKEYQLLEWNCEHLKNFVQFGRSESPQLVGITLLAGLFLFLAVSK